MNPRVVRVLAGTIAGLAATIPMSLVMMTGRRRHLQEHIDPLPPRQITARLLHAVNVDHLTNESEELVTVVNHFGYGAAMGGLFGLMPSRPVGLTPVTTGALYGVGVWAVSYLAWLPVTGFYRSATKDSVERTLRMVGAHVVWGGTLGLLFHLTERQMRARSTDTPAEELQDEPAGGYGAVRDSAGNRPRMKPR